jgi:outer membrane receptor protein involved in Fe transport
VPLINGATQPQAGTLIGNTSTPRVFGQEGTERPRSRRLTWNATDVLHLNFGLRAAYEKKEATRDLTIAAIDGTPLAGIQAVVAPLVYASVFNLRPHSLSGKRDGWKTMPSFSVQYDLADDVMGYLSYVQGFKSGGFDARSNNPTSPPATGCSGRTLACVGSFEFEDEDSQSYEAGLKSRFADDRAELNLAYYYTDFKDLQVKHLRRRAGFQREQRRGGRDPGRRARRSLEGGRQPDAARLARVDGLRIQGVRRPVLHRADTDASGQNCDYAGKTNIFVPDLAGSVALDWIVNLGSTLQLTTTLETVYSGAYYPQATLDPATKQDSYAKFNARVALAPNEGNWEIALLGRNLTDETVTGYAADIPLAARTFGAPSYGSFVAPPRSLALQARFSF